MPRPSRVAITIRRAEPEDFEGVWRTFRDEEVYSGTLQLPYPSREMWRKRCADLSDTDYVLVACAGDEIVGHAGLHPASARNAPRRAHAMWLGLVVRADWHGKGVGTRLMQALVDLADGWLNVFRIELTVFADNARAIALYRRFGFEVEGKHRSYALRGGRYVDAYFMARLRPKSPRV
jgi:putative acetyltransferase